MVFSVTALAMFLGAACAGEKAETTEAAASPDTTLPAGSVMGRLATSTESVSRDTRIYRTVDEAMPNVVYTIDGEQTTGIADLYVRGAVSAVEPGRSFSWSTEDDREVRLEHDFNDPEAWVSTIHVTMGVDAGVSEESGPGIPQTVTFGLSLDAPLDLEAARDELLGLGEIAVFLYEPSPVYDYQDGLWAVLEDGTFIGIVGDNGELTFPAIDPALEPVDVTIADLEQSEPPGPFEAVTVDGELQRTD